MEREAHTDLLSLATRKLGSLAAYELPVIGASAAEGEGALRRQICSAGIATGALGQNALARSGYGAVYAGLRSCWPGRGCLAGGTSTNNPLARGFVPAQNRAANSVLLTAPVPGHSPITRWRAAHTR